jgi:hypothetical protein
MMIGPNAFHSQFGHVGGVGGRHGQPRFDAIVPDMRDPDIVRGMQPDNNNNNNNYNNFGPHSANRGGFSGIPPARLLSGEPDNDALQPAKFGYGNGGGVVSGGFGNSNNNFNNVAAAANAVPQNQAAGPNSPPEQQNQQNQQNVRRQQQQQPQQSAAAPNGSPSKFNYGFY